MPFTPQPHPDAGEQSGDGLMLLANSGHRPFRSLIGPQLEAVAIMQLLVAWTLLLTANSGFGVRC